MDFWAAMSVVARRWYVMLPALFLAVSAAGLLYLSAPIRYVSYSTLLLGVPLHGAAEYSGGYVPGAVNPLLNQNHGLAITGTVLIERMRTPEFTRQIGVPTDGAASYTVNNGTPNPEILINGPFIVVTSESASPELARGIVQRAVDDARGELVRSQAEIGAPEATFVTFTEVVPPTEPQPQRGSRLRSTGAALALGVVGSLLATFAADSIAGRRRKVRVAAAVATPQPEPTEPQATATEQEPVSSTESGEADPGVTQIPAAATRSPGGG